MRSTGASGDAAVLQPGSELLAAGYALYSSAVMLVLSWGAGVHGFTLDTGTGGFVLTHPDMRAPDRGMSTPIMSLHMSLACSHNVSCVKLGDTVWMLMCSAVASSSRRSGDSLRLCKALKACAGQIYSVNDARYFDWPAGLRRYIDDIRQGRGQHPKQYSARYVCSLVRQSCSASVASIALHGAF